VQLRQFERSRFFTGQVLTADDLQREQDYRRDKARLHMINKRGQTPFTPPTGCEPIQEKVLCLSA
jgi:hypothetical protein